MSDQPTWTTTPGKGLVETHQAVFDRPELSGFVRAYRMPSTPAIAYPADMRFKLPNCGLVACAIAANVSLMETAEWFRNYGNRRPGSGGRFQGNWRGKTYHQTYSPFLNAKWIKHVHTKHDGRGSIFRFATWHARPGVLYILRVKGHVLTLKDGWLCDQDYLGRVETYRRKQRRVLDTWEITT